MYFRQILESSQEVYPLPKSNGVKTDDESEQFGVRTSLCQTTISLL